MQYEAQTIQENYHFAEIYYIYKFNVIQFLTNSLKFCFIKVFMH